jgi:DNA-binding MarR family transcriptional regulator
MNHDITKPRLERIQLLKEILLGYRRVLDEELQPYGITATQLRMLWTVQDNPLVSGAEASRLCSVTPQSGQATMARLEEAGWITRKSSAKNERVRVSELTASGKRILLKARELAERLDAKVWAQISPRELADTDAVLRKAVNKLSEQT